MTENELNPSSQRHIEDGFLCAVRVIIASVWLHEGLWKKVLTQDDYELSIVQQFAPTPERAIELMMLIGGSETLLAVGVLSGLFARPLAWFQILLLVVMNLTGIFFGGGMIKDPVGLLIHNLPLLACMALIGRYGPGAFALDPRRNSHHD